VVLLDPSATADPLMRLSSGGRLLSHPGCWLPLPPRQSGLRRLKMSPGPTTLDPTFSTTQVARLVDRSEQWVRAVSARDRLGHKEGRSWRYTAGELEQVRQRANPAERRGRPRRAVP